MIKVFLVEDEILIRNGIKKGIQWEREGLSFVGEASDGELAYPMILKTKPDILITDIKMPFMDGFELSKAVLRELPEIKVIILSGYGEFGYAQEAIKMGVQEYLLKPISSKRLLVAIKEVAEIIDKEREERMLLEKYSKEMEENVRRNIQCFFTMLVTEQVPMSAALEQGRQLGMELSAEKYNMILFKIRKRDHEAEYSEGVVEVLEQIQQYVDTQNHVFVYERGAEGVAFLIKGDSSEELNEKIAKFCKYLIKLIEGYDNLEYYAGVGKMVSRLRELRDCYNEADKVFSSRFVENWNRVVYQGNYLPGAVADIDIYNVYSVEDSRKMIRQFLRNGTLDEVPSFIKGYFGKNSQDNLRSLMMRQYICMDIYFSVIAFGEEIQLSKEELIENCGEIRGLTNHIAGLDSTKQYIRELLENVLLLRDSASGRKYSDILLKAKSYITENYMQEDMSLNRLASHVNMSPSYFSSVFSQESGMTFVEYLTEVRMDKAKELLMCSNQKTSEIGYQVGYKDSHYFNYIFKKTQKCSPKEYRLRGKKIPDIRACL